MANQAISKNRKFITSAGGVVVYITREQYSIYLQSRWEYDEARKYIQIITGKMVNYADDQQMVYCELSEDINYEHIKLYNKKPAFQWLMDVIEMTGEPDRHFNYDLD